MLRTPMIFTPGTLKKSGSLLSFIIILLILNLSFADRVKQPVNSKKPSTVSPPGLSSGPEQILSGDIRQAGTDIKGKRKIFL
jgi:hypothetical protein